MSLHDHIGDADVEDAVAEIMKLGPGVFGDGETADKRPNKESQDDIDAQPDGDLDEAEREARAKAGSEDGEKADKEGDEGGEEAAGADDEQFLELPAAEDGAEPERVPLTEAVEAVRKMRQLDGDITTAVIRAETEAQERQDKITNGMMQAFDAVIQSAEVTLRAMQQYLPQPPDPIMLDENSGYYDPAGYHRAKLYYDGYVQHAQKVAQELKNAQQGKGLTLTHAESETAKRELERAARYIPEFAKDETRAAKKAEWLDTLGKRYGLTMQDLDDVLDHRALRLIDEHAKMLKGQSKAPEVRKHVQETKAKITKGRVLPDRAKDGKFIDGAFKQLKETGTVDAAAALLLRSGALKGL